MGSSAVGLCVALLLVSVHGRQAGMCIYTQTLVFNLCKSQSNELQLYLSYLHALAICRVCTFPCVLYVPLVLVHSTHSGQNQVPDGRVYLPGRRDITMSNNSEWWSTSLKCIQCQLCVWWVWVCQSLHAVNTCLLIHLHQSNMFV